MKGVGQSAVLFVLLHPLLSLPPLSLSVPRASNTNTPTPVPPPNNTFVYFQHLASATFWRKRADSCCKVSYHRQSPPAHPCRLDSARVRRSLCLYVCANVCLFPPLFTL